MGYHGECPFLQRSFTQGIEPASPSSPASPLQRETAQERVARLTVGDARLNAQKRLDQLLGRAASPPQTPASPPCSPSQVRKIHVHMQTCGHTQLCVAHVSCFQVKIPVQHIYSQRTRQFAQSLGPLQFEQEPQSPVTPYEPRLSNGMGSPSDWFSASAKPVGFDSPQHPRSPSLPMERHPQSPSELGPALLRLVKQSALYMGPHTGPAPAQLSHPQSPQSPQSPHSLQSPTFLPSSLPQPRSPSLHVSRQSSVNMLDSQSRSPSFAEDGLVRQRSSQQQSAHTTPTKAQFQSYQKIVAIEDRSPKKREGNLLQQQSFQLTPSKSPSQRSVAYAETTYMPRDVSEGLTPLALESTRDRFDKSSLAGSDAVNTSSTDSGDDQSCTALSPPPYTEPVETSKAAGGCEFPRLTYRPELDGLRAFAVR